jgi:hypothetical protein
MNLVFIRPVRSSRPNSSRLAATRSDELSPVLVKGPGE